MKWKVTLVALTSAYFVSAQAGDVDQSNWISLDANGAFSLRAPPGTVFKQKQGTDSFVAEFRNPGFKLGFDYGDWSNELAGFDGDTRYTVESITVDGLTARLVTGPGLGNETWGCEGYLTAVYVVNSYVEGRKPALEMDGCTHDRAQIPIIQAIYKSIEFKR